MFFHPAAHRLAKVFSPVLNRRAATAIVEERGRQSMTHVIYSLLRRSLAGSRRTAEPKPKYRKAFFIFFHRVHPRASKGHAGNRAMHSRIIGWPAYPAFVSLRHFFEACGDELIDAFSRLRGLFGDAAMKLRRDAQRGRPGIRLFRFGATLFAPLPI